MDHKKVLSRINFDYEEDDYDRLKHRKKAELFTNKATFKKIEFDYEEDPYEPEKRR